MTLRRTTIATIAFAVGLGLPHSLVGQRRLPNPRRFSDTGSDVRDLEVPVTEDQVRERKLPSELDRDRMKSLALFGQARLLYQRGEAAKAIQAFQRAYHWNPSAGQAAAEVVPLAFFLDRTGVATRYLVIAAERGASDPQLMRQVALHLAQDGDYARAARIYKRVFEQLERAPKEADWIAAHFEAGRLYFLMEDYPRAADAFAIVADGLERQHDFGLSDEDVEKTLDAPHLTYALFGEAFLKANRIQRAERMFRKSEERSSDKPLFAFHLARIAAARGEKKRALDELTKYLDANSTDGGTEPYDLLKELLPISNDGDDNWLTRLHRIQESTPNAVVSDYLAAYYEKQGASSRALDLYRQLNDELGSNYSAQGILRTAIAANQAAPAIEVLGQTVARTSGIEALDTTGLIAVESDDDETGPDGEATGGGPTDFAIAVFDEAKQSLVPPKTTLQRCQLFGVGLLAIKTGRLQQGHTFVDAALKSVGESEETDWRLASGLEMFMADDLDGATEQFEALLDRQGADSSPTVTFYLATVLALDGNSDRAVQRIDAALAKSPDLPLLECRRAWIAYHDNANDTATQRFRAFLEKYGDNYASEGLRELVKEARVSLSNLRLLEKDVDGAVEYLQQVLDEYPEDVGAMNDLGYLLADENRDLQRALRMVQFAVEQDPKNMAYLDSLGWVHFRLGNFEDAVGYLKQAVSGSDPDGIILEHLGDVYDKLNQTENARSAWNRAIAAFEKHDDAERIGNVKNKLTKSDD